ncbi:PREDICTED: polynucleotide 5'-hydroxyl-kinase NOL9-like [Thamnophis sirtalis]|uniref:Polynucleotide 5'-hydroxyl-kinase NOL9-like n=1 Tax=Thamnophis sirtalis TaxID=35019 RepID=A0A6I9XRF2_9SAUR|nr:PREDICTED: polynucleotide 5'-hydroxyl-kinase NOL9-like [Thamnophis sirtalis]
MASRRRRRRLAGPKRLQNGAPRRETPPPPELPAEPATLTVAKTRKGRAVVLLPAEQNLTFTGKCRLTCLHGSVQVLGFTIAAGQPPYDLYSPHTYCALTIEAAAGIQDPEKSEKEVKLEAKALLRAHFVPQEARGRLLRSFRPGCSIFLLEPLETAETKFILSHSEFAQIFRAKVSPVAA